MFRLEDFPEEPPVFAGCPRDPPESPWGGTPTSSQPGSPTAEQRGRLGADPPGGPAGAGGGAAEAPAFRGRSRSAPPLLWAALRYGRELRRMSDEFQLQVLPRPRSLGGGRWGWLGVWGGRRPPTGAPPARRDPP